VDGTCIGVNLYANGELMGTDETDHMGWPEPPSSRSSVSLVAEAFISYSASTETIASAPVTVTNTPPPQGLSICVSQSSDEAEESSSGKLDLAGSDLELVLDGSDQTVGMRFNGIATPHGATITRTDVQFRVDEINSESTVLTSQGENADQAATFAGVTGNIYSRSRTAAAVSWSPNPRTTVGLLAPISGLPISLP